MVAAAKSPARTRAPSPRTPRNTSKTSPPEARPKANSLHATGLDWQSLPFHPVNRASNITGASPSHTYALLKAGELSAVTLGGKTLITTASLIEYLAKAKKWRPNRERVARAVAARPDMARKARSEAR
jgi:hypothetical protein